MTEGPLRAAIVGAGPSGFYAAGQLLAVDEPAFAVDLYDRLPTPYGLVRSGVAPDHPKIKSVTRAYDKTTAARALRFFGHVELGSDITRRQLLEHYHVVLYTLGTSIDRRLGIPGEELRGSHAATEFVAWYNGHPDHCGPGGRPAGASRRSSSEPATSRSTSRGCSRWRRRSLRAPTRRIMRSRCSRPRASRRSRSSPAAARCRRRSRIPSCSRWACSSAADLEVVGGELDELSAVALERRRQDPAAERRDPAGVRRRGRRPESRSPSASASSPLRSSCSATSTAMSAP